VYAHTTASANPTRVATAELWHPVQFVLFIFPVHSRAAFISSMAEGGKLQVAVIAGELDGVQRALASREDVNAKDKVLNAGLHRYGH